MKYVILSIAAIAVIFGVIFLITGLIRRKLKKKPPITVKYRPGLMLHFPGRQE